MSPSDLTLRQVTEAASVFLKKNHNDLTLPVPIEEIVEFKLGITIQVIPGIKELLAIDAYIAHDFSFITVDDKVFSNYPARTRFSIAHEVGHMILHREWYREHGPKTIEDAQSFQDGIDLKTYNYMERQADTFAGLVLVPSEALVKELKDIIGKVTVIGAFSTPIAVLSQKFGVSESVILIRMQNDKILTQINGVY